MKQNSQTASSLLDLAKDEGKVNPDVIVNTISALDMKGMKMQHENIRKKTEEKAHVIDPKIKEEKAKKEADRKLAKSEKQSAQDRKEAKKAAEEAKKKAMEFLNKSVWGYEGYIHMIHDNYIQDAEFILPSEQDGQATVKLYDDNGYYPFATNSEADDNEIDN